jgi:hypothetical protein
MMKSWPASTTRLFPDAVPLITVETNQRPLVSLAIAPAET